MIGAHKEGGKIVRWQFHLGEKKFIKQCCKAQKPTKTTAMQEDMHKLEVWDQSLYHKISARSKGVRAWRRVNL